VIHESKAALGRSTVILASGSFFTPPAPTLRPTASTRSISSSNLKIASVATLRGCSGTPISDPLARSWWCDLTVLVLLSMALFVMYERFQALGYGHLHALWMVKFGGCHEKQIVEFN
jgi:hypothetical protein